MRKVIALDLDGVIADIDEALKIELSQRGHADYDFTDWLTTYHECDLSNEIMTPELFWRNLKPFSDSWHQVNKWFSKGHDVYIVTARRTEGSIGATQKWLDEWKINTMNPIFCQMGQKHQAIADLNPEFIVEDNPNEVISLLDKGYNAFLRRAWYNEKYWEALPSIGSLLELKIND
jgi:5'(3')-deoxyribonucleotidase